jgi:hypothetical protein
MEFMHTFTTVITVGQQLTFAVITAIVEHLWVVGITLLGVYLLCRPHQHL